MELFVDRANEITQINAIIEDFKRNHPGISLTCYYEPRDHAVIIRMDDQSLEEIARRNGAIPSIISSGFVGHLGEDFITDPQAWVNVLNDTYKMIQDVKPE